MKKTYEQFWKRTADLKGSTSRADYWKIFLINLAIEAVPLAIGVGLLIPALTGFQIYQRAYQFSSGQVSGSMAWKYELITSGLLFLLVLVYQFAKIVPQWTMRMRRFHDAGFSSKWVYGLLIMTLAIRCSVLLAPVAMANIGIGADAVIWLGALVIEFLPAGCRKQSVRQWFKGPKQHKKPKQHGKVIKISLKKNRR